MYLQIYEFFNSIVVLHIHICIITVMSLIDYTWIVVQKILFFQGINLTYLELTRMNQKYQQLLDESALRNNSVQRTQRKEMFLNKEKLKLIE